MDHTDKYYIDCLIQDIEQKFGRTFRSATDFDRLERIISQNSDDRLNASTLKRIWGYSQRRCIPRRSTLTILARLLDCIDWEEYVRRVDIRRRIESGFIPTSSVSVSDLNVGDRISFRWSPDRKTTLRYLGGNTFSVEEQENSSLRPGDTLTTQTISEGQPFYCTDVARSGIIIGDYIAGEEHGIHTLRLHPRNN